MINILIIDDSTFTCEIIRRILSDENTCVTSVNSAKEAFKLLEVFTPDIILLDMILPDMVGYEVCTMLKGMNSTHNLPIIFLTSNNDEKSIIRGFEVGATDYIVKPFSSAELKARVSCHAQSKIMSDKLYIANQELKFMMEEIRQQGYKDPLTNLYNRKYFLENMIDWKDEMRRCGYKSFLYVIDVDNFKTVNDTYGHAMGDYVLYTVAELLRNAFDVSCVVGRWGGDEFLAIAFDLVEEKAMEIGSRMCQSIADYEFTYDGDTLACSSTIGFAEFDINLKIEENLKLADKALYLGKERGRNCCISAIETGMSEVC